MGILGRRRIKEPEVDEDREKSTEVAPGRRRWSTAFLMAGSAVLGATAVALWNRRTIASLRTQFLAAPERPTLPKQKEEEIF